jgi:anti-sigma B factor antagonist
MQTTDFRVGRRVEEGVNVLTPSGRITLGASVREMKLAFEGLAAEGHTVVALNLSEVAYVDSAGLGSIVTGLNLLRKKGGNMTLCCVQPRVSQLLELTHLTGVVASFDNEEAAIQALKKPLKGSA